MALKERTESNNKFLVVKHHSIVLESKEPQEGYEEVHPTNPKTGEVTTKYIKRFAAVEGVIRRIEWYDTKDNYATRFLGIKIHLRDGGEYYQLDLPFNSRAYDTFTKLMENIDYTKPVEFSAWHDRKEDRTAFAVKQDGTFVKYKYTRDNMGDCPVPTQDSFGKWQFQTQKEWLYKRLTQVVIPQVEALNTFDEPEPEYSGEEEVIVKAAPSGRTVRGQASPPSKIEEPPDDEIGTSPYDDNGDIPF